MVEQKHNILFHDLPFTSIKIDAVYNFCTCINENINMGHLLFHIPLTYFFGDNSSYGSYYFFGFHSTFAGCGYYSRKCGILIDIFVAQ